MKKEELLEIIKKEGMTPLVDQEENPGMQLGWYKMCTEPIPKLDLLMEETGNSLWNSIKVARRQFSGTYQYIVQVPMSWFE